ncbi:MAG: ABC transporter ATP-binding protein/permease [Holosporales bacterium]|nr:ABC transporter ATP-binding protein/permease [Holosporales bacterium]
MRKITNLENLGKKNLTKRIWIEHIRSYRSHLCKAFCCMLVAAASTAAFPYFLKPAFDFIFQNHDKVDLIFFGICIFVSFIVKGMASYGESFIMTYIGQKIVFDIQERLFERLVKADLSFFNDHHSGDLLSRFSNDVALMRNAVSTTISGLGKELMTFIFLVGLMVYRDAVLAIFACVLFPSALIPIILLGRKMKKIVSYTQSSLGSFSSYLTQIFQGIRIVKAYNSEEMEVNRMRQKIADLLIPIMKSTKIKALLHPISECIAGIAIISVLIYGGMQVMDGYKTIGDLISFLGALLISYEPVRRLTQLSANAQEGLVAASRIFDIIDTEPAIRNSSTPIRIADQINIIKFEGVSFRYGSSRTILDDISFEIKKGQTVAFVGRSGSGKSTLLNLIPRFHDTISGKILVDGTDIRDLDLISLRHQIALVTQENILFDASFYDNIAYGNREASNTEIIAAAKSALADDFIRKSEDGYQTLVGECGIRISGGQRQRIAIARAMLKNAPILLLDEATSSLDVDSEKSVQSALDTLMKNRTTIIVTHRLSSIVNADLIYVLEEGSIKESGTHHQLISLGGIYSALWQTQNGH